MKSFCKQEECPASEELAALCDRRARAYTDRLEEHLGVCEFCSAEVDLYLHYPPVEDEVTPGEMPRPLFELAEALLRGKGDLRLLDKLIGKSD